MSNENRVRVNSSNGAWIEMLKYTDGLLFDVSESYISNELVNKLKFNLSLMLKHNVSSFL
jgi:hypothetical protein